jgi:hypothetical protein
MRNKIIISITIFLIVLLIPTLLYADNKPIPFPDLVIKNILDQIKDLREMIENIEVENTTIVKNEFSVEYASCTDGPWTKESYPESRYRRTGYTYNGITTYLVEEIIYCWNDEHTFMFIAK